MVKIKPLISSDIGVHLWFPFLSLRPLRLCGDFLQARRAEVVVNPVPRYQTNMSIADVVNTFWRGVVVDCEEFAPARVGKRG